MDKVNSDQNQRKGKMMTGIVVSKKTDKTVIVEVVRFRKHPIYKKAIRRTKRFAAHLEMSEISVGDRVKITEVRPLSKTKNFLVTGKVI